MKRRLIQRPLARLDLIEIADYIAKNNFNAAMRFLAAAESTFEQLRCRPALGATGEYSVPFLRNMRRWRVAGFTNYLIFYFVTDSAVEIVRVIHGARDIESLFESQ